ncbi:MAG: sigma-54 dependent transcriptional regulator [Deltaproteobacteria bacterium]|nr:sigma-54 dependent transcriptional regulator [Deltaproteobacteria bacterium]
MSDKVLIIDDDDSMRWVLRKTFEKNGYKVSIASGGKEGFALLKNGDYGLAFVDIIMPDINGLELLRMAKENKVDTCFVIMTAQNTMKNAVEAMKLGAYDYITKPFDIEEVKDIAGKAFESRNISLETARPGMAAESYEVGINIIGKSAAMQKVYKTIGKVSGSDVTVLIEGESGTGKEVIARAIHNSGERKNKPFVAVNSAAIPGELLESELFGHEKGAFSGATGRKPGKFELARGGTLFLDEIADMSMDLQMKLLRALQEKEVDSVGGTAPIKIDVRVTAATNQDLARAVKERKFRQDLYYRLNVVNIKMPPLRDRRGDIHLLVEYFLETFSKELNMPRKYLSNEAMKIVNAFSWPGNVRELENTMRRAVVLSRSETIMPEEFPSRLREDKDHPGSGIDEISLEEIMRIKLTPLIAAVDENNTEGLYSMVLSQMERPLIRLVLEKCRWNQIKAAKVLGINRNTLKKKMDLLDIRKGSNGK